MSTTDDLRTLSREIAEQIYEDTGYEITSADLLDALATHGITLKREPGVATAAYQQEVVR
jgi:hypothetical protein